MAALAGPGGDSEVWEAAQVAMAVQFAEALVTASLLVEEQVPATEVLWRHLAH